MQQARRPVRAGVTKAQQQYAFMPRFHPARTSLPSTLFETFEASALNSAMSDPTADSCSASIHFLARCILVRAVVVYAEAVCGPRAPFGAPERKPLENLRETSLRDRMRPEPVVFLRLAFSPQLSVGRCVSHLCAVKSGAPRWFESHGSESNCRAKGEDVHFLIPALGYPQLAQVCF